MLPQFAIREEETYTEDCLAIQREWGIEGDWRMFERLYEANRLALERNPFFNARPLDSIGTLWIRETKPYRVGELNVPGVYVSFEVVQEPPDGLIALHHLRTDDQVHPIPF